MIRLAHMKAHRIERRCLMLSASALIYLLEHFPSRLVWDLVAALVFSIEPFQKRKQIFTTACACSAGCPPLS
eukprot:1334622-Amphidinium_carterae.1